MKISGKDSKKKLFFQANHRMEKIEGLAKNFYPVSDVDGRITFNLNGDIPEGSDVKIVVEDVATGTRRGFLSLSGMKSADGYWWVPPPGNHTESRKNLGDVILSIHDGGFTERKFYLDRGGPGRKIEIQDKILEYLRLSDHLYSTFWEIFIAGEYSDIGEIRKDGVVVDIGSNYGLFSAYALDRYYPRRIVGVEPNENCYRVSKSTLEEFHQFEVLNFAVTEKSGWYSLEMDDDISAGGRIVESEKQEIQGIDINSLLAMIEEDKIDLMKIDCEGGEMGIFKTITDENLAKIDRFVLEYHSKEIHDFIVEKLSSSGFMVEEKNTVFISEGVGILTAKKI